MAAASFVKKTWLWPQASFAKLKETPAIGNRRRPIRSVNWLGLRGSREGQAKKLKLRLGIGRARFAADCFAN